MTDLQTISPDDLPPVTAATDETQALVFQPGGVLAKMPFSALLARLVRTDLAKGTSGALAADLAHIVDSVALVFDDPDPIKNGWWRKLGASGAGSWVQFDTLSSSAKDLAEAAAALAAVWAEGTLPGGAGTKSAKEWATDAAGSVGSLQASLAALFTRPGFLSATTGKINTSDVSFYSTGLLDLNSIELKQIKLQGHPNVASLAYYDENQAFISAAVSSTIGAYITAIPAKPSNAVYAAATYKVADAANQIFRFAGKGTAAVGTPQAIADSQALLSRLFPRQGFINAAGNFQADVAWRTTPQIDLAYLWLTRVNLTGNTNVNSIAYYDEAGVFISGSIGSGSARVASVPAPPSNAVSFTMTYQLSDVANCSVGLVSTAAASPWRSDGKVSLDVGVKLTNVGYINTAGLAVVGDAAWTYSDFIKCSPGEKIGFTLYGHPNVSNLTFYDSAQQPIPGSMVIRTSTAGVWSQSNTAPAGAASYRISSNTTAKTATHSTSLSAQLLASTTVPTPKFSGIVFKRPRAMKLTSANKIVGYGDSRSSNDYAFVATNLAAITGAQAEAGGISGSSIATQVSNANMAALFARNADAVIWLPAGNEQGRLGTVGTFDGTVVGEPLVTQTDISLDFSATGATTMIQALDHGVRKWKAQYENIRARAGLTGSESETVKGNMIRALLKPMLILCSDLPQKRSGDPYISDPANWERKRQAIIEVAYRNKIHCVDTMAIMGWDMNLEPSWTSPTDKVTNNGNKTMDGLHQNEFGNFEVYQVACADAGLA